jgi:hypothetical protein
MIVVPRGGGLVHSATSPAAATPPASPFTAGRPSVAIVCS